MKNRYLISAIVWTLIALAALYVLLFMASGGTAFGRICGLVIVTMCIVGQWLRWWKAK